MKTIIAAFLCFALTASVQAAPLLSVDKIIATEGCLVFTDGSSLYDFEKNGTFYSEPSGLSGRTITGRWTRQDNTFTVQGTWGWMNGISKINDFRRLTLTVYPTAAEPGKVSRFLWLPPRAKTPRKIYRCYFVVEELVTVPSLK